MENIVTDISSLHKRMAELEAQEQAQINDFKLAKKELTESLSPTRLFKSAVHKFSSSPMQGQSGVDLITGLVAGAVTNRLYAPASAGFFRRITAPIVQYMVTNFVKNKVTRIREKNAPSPAAHSLK
jgi:hypothetical protein